MGKTDAIHMHTNGQKAPWLSVIIPVFNAERYLKECVESILNQTFADFELMLVDDGSTDGTGSICMEYAAKDSRVKYLKKENGGAFQTRIYGAERSKGTYITFSDADDYYAGKNAFKIMHDEISETNCSVLQFERIRKYNHLKRIAKSVRKRELTGRDEFLSREYPLLLCGRNENARLNVPVWNKVYHRSLFDALPNSNSTEFVFQGEDLILNLHLLEKCESILFLPNSLYVYCATRGGTARFSVRTMHDLDKIKKFQLMFLERWNGEGKDRIIRNLYADVAGWFFAYIQEGLKHLSEDDLKKLVEEILQLPRFKMARQYFVEKQDEQWEAVNLLRLADSDEYIKRARMRVKKKSLKERIYNLLRKVYISI